MNMGKVNCSTLSKIWSLYAHVDSFVICLWSKVVCFVLFCLSCWGLPNQGASCHTLGIFAKLSMSKGASTWSQHWLDLRLFGATVWKLLIIEPFSQWKLNKIETENCTGIWGHSCVLLDRPWQFRFSRAYFSLFSELRCGRYLFLSGFYCWKFKEITKIEFGWKNQLSSQCVHTWANGTNHTNISGVVISWLKRMNWIRVYKAC